MRTVIALALLMNSGLPFAHVNGTDDQIIQKVFNMFAYENLVCAAFYGITSQCLENKAVVERAQDAALRFIEIGRWATEEAKLKKETIPARLEMAGKDLLHEIGNDCRNISIILINHGLQCKRLAEQPTQRFQELIDQATQNRPR